VRLAVEVPVAVEVRAAEARLEALAVVALPVGRRPGAVALWETGALVAASAGSAPGTGMPMRTVPAASVRTVPSIPGRAAEQALTAAGLAPAAE
jgi:hypothetical protein